MQCSDLLAKINVSLFLGWVFFYRMGVKIPAKMVRRREFFILQILTLCGRFPGPMKLKGKRVIIAGGAGRLGRLVAFSLAKEGALLSIYYNRSKAPAERLVAEIKKMGGKVHATGVDLAKISNIRNAVRSSAKLLGGIDALIDCAGVFDVPQKKWQELFDINLKAPYFLIEEAAPFLKRSKNGKVILVADTYGQSPSAKFLAYGITKAGVIAMTMGYAKKLAPKVLVNCVCPGVIARNGSDEAISFDQLNNRDCFANARNNKASKRAIEATLLKRPINAQDVVDAVLFLARNDSMTGQAVYVDGGRHV